MIEYPLRLTEKVVERMALGEKPLAIFQHLMADNEGCWLMCVEQGTWADTQSEYETAKRALGKAVDAIYAAEKASITKATQEHLQRIRQIVSH